MRMEQRCWRSGVLIWVLFLSACAPAIEAAHDPSIISSVVPSPVQTTRPKPTSTNVLPAEIPAVSPTEIINFQPVVVCSPIEGMTPKSLEESVVTSFLPPPPGSDNPHHGVDLADIDPATNFALEGRRVNAMMAGKIAGVILDRFPYGNAVIVETSLNQIPPAWTEVLELPNIQPVDLTASPLTCPDLASSLPAGGSRGKSFYVLYAHLLQESSLKIGEQVICGQQLGTIGSSGNSINPHLHLEARLGSENMVFASMAHYEPSATMEEMGAYCLWRISGYFQLIDPMRLVDLLEPG